jgi:outer membrane lipoprotein carrier protein
MRRTPMGFARRAIGILVSAPAIAAAALAFAAAPAAPGGPADPELAAALKRFDAAQAKIERISARFQEVKSIALLREPVVQGGEFYHTKPDKFLWEYTSPEPKILMLNGKSIVAYYPAQKRAEEIHTRFSKRIVKYLGLGSVLKDLEDEYEITLSRENDVPGTDLLVLRPKARTIAKRLSLIRIWVDREINQPRRIEYTESDGDRSLLSFDRIQINPEISLSKYQLKLPEDVTVTNGLTSFFGGGSSR